MAKKSKTKRELETELQFYKTVFEWLPDHIKWYFNNIGKMVRVYGFGGRAVIGTLLPPSLEVSWVEVGTYEKTYDFTEGKYFMEKKVVRIPSKLIQAFDLISERELYKEEGTVSGEEEKVEEDLSLK